MNVVEEYLNGKTKIRIHDDYIRENERKETKESKELIISLVLNLLENKIAHL